MKYFWHNINISIAQVRTDTEVYPFLPTVRMFFQSEKKKECITDGATQQHESFVCHLITREAQKAKLFVASNALYESQWSKLLYFCISSFRV